MKRKILSLPLIMIAVAAVEHSGQTPVPNPQEQERELRMRMMRELETVIKTPNRPTRNLDPTPTIDKETAERIKVARRVEAEDLSRFGAFLQGEKTGIFKLLPDHDCVAKNIVRIDGDCKDFVFASSSFSFRNNGYAHPLYHDIGFNNGELYNDAFFTQGMFVSLGDVPIEQVSRGRDGLKVVFALLPASDPARAHEMAGRLKAGIEFGGFKYYSSIKPVENTTYVLRSIAYSVANTLPVVTDKTSNLELRFHTLPLDKRADIIVAFRIVRVGADGALTVLWKELERRESPKITFPKDEKFADFKPDSAPTQP